MRIVSMYDGMGCGMISMILAGVQVDEYVACEVDKYAVQTTKHNFQNIRHMGDVFSVDFTQFEGFDFLVGGSPCTYWSIAQTKNRETEASGLGWELFQQYVRALHEIKPKYFIYENNKSMSEAIRKSICEAFGFEQICINSALVSAQNRKRYYWCGIRQQDGTYRKANIEQPEDRGILLRNVLDTNGIALTDKGYPVIGSSGRTTYIEYFIKHQGNMVAEQISPLTEGEMDYMVRQVKDGRNHFDFGFHNTSEMDKSHCVTTRMSTVPYNCMIEKVANEGSIQIGALPRPNGELSTSQAFRIYSIDGKAVTLKGCGGGAGGKTRLYAVPVTLPECFIVKEATKKGYAEIPRGVRRHDSAEQ